MDFPKDKKYKIIYADPPWEYKRDDSRGLPYEGMTAYQISRLPVECISDDDCVLFIWIVSAKMPDALKVIESWGFTYKTIAFCWVKTTSENKLAWGMGEWTRSNIELCLIATKGRPKRVNADVQQVIKADRKEHSRKPDIVRDEIIRLCGDLPRIELFARRQAIGWDVFGNDDKLNLQPLEVFS